MLLVNFRQDGDSKYIDFFYMIVSLLLDLDLEPFHGFNYH
jgi:hypothetical protein